MNTLLKYRVFLSLASFVAVILSAVYFSYRAGVDRAESIWQERLLAETAANEEARKVRELEWGALVELKRVEYERQLEAIKPIEKKVIEYVAETVFVDSCVLDDNGVQLLADYVDAEFPAD